MRLKIFLMLLIAVLLVVVGCGMRRSDTTVEPAPAEPAGTTGESEEPYDMYKHSDSGRSSSTPVTTRPAVPSQSGLKAGFADDNLQFNSYLEFLEKYKAVPQIKFAVQERIIIKVLDKDGNGLPDAQVVIKQPNGDTLAQALTYADGTTLFFPSEYPKINNYTANITYGSTSKSFALDRKGERTQEFKLPIARTKYEKIPVDILFVLDTTGSMGEEIQRLKSTLMIIHENLTTMNIPLSIRFGMVMYKDRGDSYITKTIKFTDDAADFQKKISTISADGGGDTPEDMQKALEVAVTEMDWQKGGVRLTYLITDASAHIDYGQQFTLLSSAQEARKKGIKLFSVGTGGLDVEGELNLRQIAQYTMGKYIFLTYGERGESDGGAQGSVSHHTGANFTSDKLETIIIRFSKEEIGAFALKPVEEDEDYFEATKGSENSIKVLKELFGSMVTQLVNYSTVSIAKDTPVAVVPLASDKAIAASAEYFTEQLYHAAADYKGWKSVERKDIQKILNEITFNMSGLVDEADMIKLEKLTGAKLLITGSLYEKDGSYEVYLKLLRTESGEVLAVTRAKLDLKLGLK